MQAIKKNNLHRIPHYCLIFLKQNLKNFCYKSIWHRIKNHQYFKLYLQERLFKEEFEEMPWLNYEIIDLFRKKINRKVIEFGSGRSTLWLAANGFFTLSIEHNAFWANKIEKKLKDKKLEKMVNLHLMDVQPELESHAEIYLTPFRQKNIHGPFYILIDGLFRNQCLMACLPLIEEGSIIILHDADRVEYRASVETICRNKNIQSKKIFGPGHGTPDFTHAVIFQKIKK